MKTPLNQALVKQSKQSKDNKQNPFVTAIIRNPFTWPTPAA